MKTSHARMAKFSCNACNGGDVGVQHPLALSMTFQTTMASADWFHGWCLMLDWLMKRRVFARGCAGGNFPVEMQWAGHCQRFCCFHWSCFAALWILVWHHLFQSIFLSSGLKSLMIWIKEETSHGFPLASAVSVCLCLQSSSRLCCV